MILLFLHVPVYPRLHPDPDKTVLVMRLNWISSELLWIVLFHEASPVGDIWCRFNRAFTDCFVLIEKSTHSQNVFSTFSYSDLNLFVYVSSLTFFNSSLKYSSASFPCLGVEVSGWRLPVWFSILGYLWRLSKRVLYICCISLINVMFYLSLTINAQSNPLTVLVNDTPRHSLWIVHKQ